MTGWRVGYALASGPITAAIRKYHDFLTVGAPTPLQLALADAIERDTLSAGLSSFYRKKRDFFVRALKKIGFLVSPVEGAYYVMADFSRLSNLDDRAFARELVLKFGVAAVPGSSFYAKEAEEGKRMVRFCFCKKESTLQNAIQRLERLAR